MVQEPELWPATDMMNHRNESGGSTFVFTRKVSFIAVFTLFGLGSFQLTALQDDHDKLREELCRTDINVRAFDGTRVWPSDVVFTQDQGGMKFEGITDEEGDLVLRLKPGQYHLRVASRGWRVYEKHPISIQCEAGSAPIKIKVKMELPELRD